jgi:glycosyltransferase involved in cell wall biosynthesis
MNLIGITRVRNEALIIADTVNHFLARCDHIVMYDDCSTDDTVEIALEAGGDRLTVIPGTEHRANRHNEETRHRKIVHERAEELGADWCLCFDADERLVGDLPALDVAGVTGYTFRLFDGYLTEERQELYYPGEDLAELPRLWGPEYRDILMLFRSDRASWTNPGLRQPFVRGVKKWGGVFVKHYGKCMSVEQWEEACDYYSKGFPPSFRQRWAPRRGKAIHTRSDFGRPLFSWTELMSAPSEWVAL